MAHQRTEHKRLMIREMVLENFKSYAGEQQVGPFHKCFSSVVGPNGSGKSNVIDAMLFVFGKRAKQLRLNKVSELIHNSSNHRNLDTAKVSVFFQEIIDTGEETFEVLDGSEFTVARTAHRNNSSNYYIGARKSNFGEVTELLKSKGIDLDNNRFLILQGEVEQISMMKPKAQTQHETGLLEYLEDIVGTDKYVEHIEAGAKRLEEMTERRQAMVQRLKIVEKEKDALEDSRAAAEAYLDKERECTKAQCTIYQLHVRDGTRNIGIIEKNLQELEAKLQYETNKLQGYSVDLKEAERRYKEEGKVQAGIQAELDKTDETFKEFERKDIKMREDIKHLKAKLKKLGDKLTKDSAKAEECARRAAEAEAEVPWLQQEAERLTEQLKKEETALERMRDGIKGTVEGHQQALQKVRAELAPWERQMAEVQSRLDVATAERDLLTQQQTDAKQRLQDAEVGSAQATKAAARKQEEIAEMRQAATKHREDAAAARKAAEMAGAEVARLEGGLREVRGKLEQRRSDTTAQRSQSAVIQALMQAKAKGEIPGIYGRLGDLGAVDKKYDVAISTACGALDYMVVADTAAAQRCVELLRRRSLGVATFLLLDKQRHLARAAAEKAAPPEGMKRLFDLVKVRDDALRVAFYFGLGNTLVAADLEQASRIAYGGDKRWSRVVTMQGEIINESGTMTGGGGRARGGRICVGSAAPQTLDTRDAAAELARAEAEFDTSKQALQDARDRAESAAAAVAKAESELAALEVAVPKAEMEVRALLQRAQDLKDRLAELKSAAKIGAAEAKQLKALEATIAATNAELKPLQESASGLQTKAAKLQGQIDNAGGEPLRNKKALVGSLQESISKAEEEGARKRVEAQTAQKQAEKLQKEVVKAEKDQAATKVDLKGLTAANQELEEAAVEVVEAHKRISALLAEKAAELAIIKEEYDTKKKEVNIIRTVEVELQNKISDQQTSLEFETHARAANARRADEGRKKVAQMAGSKDLPQPLTEKEMAPLKLSDLEFKVTVMEEELTRMRPDMGAIEAYRKKEADYSARVKELEAATAERDEVRKGHEEVRKRRLDEFMHGFNVISMKLKEMYQMITLGGDAELELVDSLDPFSEGIVFSVRPPKKSWKNIANLSGGEKTLSSLSLVFALHHYKPTPLYVMDEIDAALDFKNVSIVAHYIKERTKNAQFVIISLRNNMFELADRLVGIYKTDNATKSVAINPGEFSVGNTASAKFSIALAAA